MDDSSSLGAWPQTFKLTVDEDTAKKCDELYMDVVAWFPQVGELSIGKITVPLPKAGSPSVRLRHAEPLKVELHWRAYAAPASPELTDWEAEAAPVASPDRRAGWF